MRTFRSSGALAAAALIVVAAPALADALPGGNRVQGELKRDADGKLILVPSTPSSAAPVRPSATPAPVPPRPAAATPAAAAPVKQAAPQPAAPQPSATQAAAKTPEDLDKVSCSVIAWQPGMKLETCLSALRDARARRGS
jgi:hypothetical protein